VEQGDMASAHGPGGGEYVVNGIDKYFVSHEEGGGGGGGSGMHVL
jgi:hypothetical protein